MIVECAATWRPDPTWSETIRPAYEALIAGVTGLDASHAWSEIAMMMGDTRAAPLALVVCLHASRELDRSARAHPSTSPHPPTGIHLALLGGPLLEDRRLAAHRDLCMLDLGLAHADAPIRIASLGDPDTVTSDPSTLDAWLQRALAPFDGDLARAAWFALRVAARRTELLDVDPIP